MNQEEIKSFAVFQTACSRTWVVSQSEWSNRLLLSFAVSLGWTTYALYRQLSSFKVVVPSLVIILLLGIYATITRLLIEWGADSMWERMPESIQKYVQNVINGYPTGENKHEDC